MTSHRFTEAEDRHLAFIRALPCVITGRAGVDACHVSYADSHWNKPIVGINGKADFWWVLPMTRAKHREQHRGGERQFWTRHGFDVDVPGLSPLMLCLELYAVSGDRPAALAAIRAHLARVSAGGSDLQSLLPPVLERPVKRKRGPGPKGRSTFQKGRKLEGRGFDRHPTLVRGLDGKVKARKK